MTKYNLKIEIEETGLVGNPARERSVWDCKELSPKEVMNVLDLIHVTWVEKSEKKQICLRCGGTKYANAFSNYCDSCWEKIQQLAE